MNDLAEQLAKTVKKVETVNKPTVITGVKLASVVVINTIKIADMNE